MKEREEEVHAFNQSLQKKADKAKEFYRFTDTEKLDSYLKPNATFGVSKFGVGKDADYKCMTVEDQSKFFGQGGGVQIAYPADEIREGSKTANYTQFPRTQNHEVKENIHSTKNSAFATETEVRIVSNTKIPVGKIRITFKDYMSFRTRDEMQEKYKSLGELSFPNASEDFLDNDD